MQLFGWAATARQVCAPRKPGPCAHVLLLPALPHVTLAARRGVPDVVSDNFTWQVALMLGFLRFCCFSSASRHPIMPCTCLSVPPDVKHDPVQAAQYHMLRHRARKLPFSGVLSHVLSGTFFPIAVRSVGRYFIGHFVFADHLHLMILNTWSCTTIISRLYIARC
jgi:hypothetical protein